MAKSNEPSAAAAARESNAKVMNRTDLTRRLVARLKGEEAVVAGIGNTNFDLWAVGQRAAEFLHAGQHGPGVSHRSGRRAGASRSAA